MRSCLKNYQISPFNDGSQVMLKKPFREKRFPSNGGRATIADGEVEVEEQKQIIEN